MNNQPKLAAVSRRGFLATAIAAMCPTLVCGNRPVAYITFLPGEGRFHVSWSKSEWMSINKVRAAEKTQGHIIALCRRD